MRLVFRLPLAVTAKLLAPRADFSAAFAVSSPFCVILMEVFCSSAKSTASCTDKSAQLANGRFQRNIPVSTAVICFKLPFFIILHPFFLTILSCLSCLFFYFTAAAYANVRKSSG